MYAFFCDAVYTSPDWSVGRRQQTFPTTDHCVSSVPSTDLDGRRVLLSVSDHRSIHYRPVY